MRGLRLFHRQDCHLCEEMFADLQRIQGEPGFSLELIDIDRHPDIFEHYTSRVPVLEGDNGELLCEAFLDPVVLLNYLHRG